MAEPITPREQELVDICFQLVLKITEPEWVPVVAGWTDEEKAVWVAMQLSKCGFKTRRQGSSWGVLFHAK